jgi:hypothetical protein
MRRELAQLLDELHDGLLAIEARNGLRLSQVDMTLPIELRPVFRDGGCVLLAEFSRGLGADDWTPTPSRLRLGWSLDGDVAAEASA